jgi:hypothetical protein
MKKILLQKLFLIFAFLPLFSISCKKEADKVPPVISLNGSDSVSVQIHTVYSDAGATALDNSDGSVAVTNDCALLNPDTGTAGTYIIHYYASDVEGNKAQATRTVTVDIGRPGYLGNFSATDNCPSVGSFSSLETITAGAADDKIIISNFASTNANCTASVNGMNITIEAQQIGILTNVHGTGTINSKGKVISLSYTYTYNALTETCSATLNRQ